VSVLIVFLYKQTHLCVPKTFIIAPYSTLGEWPRSPRVD